MHSLSWYIKHSLDISSKLDGVAFYLSQACQLHENDISSIQTQSTFPFKSYLEITIQKLLIIFRGGFE